MAHRHHAPLQPSMWFCPDSSACAAERRFHLAGANPARQLMLQSAAIGAGHGGNDMG